MIRSRDWGPRVLLPVPYPGLGRFLTLSARARTLLAVFGIAA
jgi:hypothetical protein